ncbi:hypothetical protein BJY04DRAFT_98811 [Aspergillus karnatakaensis]|uniref:fungal specific transcription factor domain-containing protein n=1 Tax=Aspergillus karnatakaensis TaxID=1810916 RepID=UPI003CCDC199
MRMKGQARNNQTTRRLAKACQRCRSRRVRCSGEEPCSACDRSSQECVYRAEPPRRRRRVLSPAILPNDVLVTPRHDLSVRNGVHQPQLRTGLVVKNHEDGAIHFYGSSSHFCFLHWIYLRLQRELHQDEWQTSTDTEGMQKWELSRFIFSSSKANLPSAQEIAASKHTVLPVSLGSHFLECYFRRLHPLIPFLDHARIQELWELSNTGSVIEIDPEDVRLLQLTLAVGACLAGKGPCDSPDTTEKWSHILLARSMEGVDLFTDPTLTKIQFIILRAIFSIQKCNVNDSYMYFGHAARSALASGMNRAQAVSAYESLANIACLTFWSLYIFERSAALFTGRQSALQDRFIDTPLPQDVARDGYVSPYDSPQLNCSWIRAMAALARIADRIIALSTPSITPRDLDLHQIRDVIAECEMAMDEMRSDLPSYLQFWNPAVPIGEDWQELQRAHVGFTHQLTHLVMYRPILLFASLYRTRQEAQNIAGDGINVRQSIANAVSSSKLLIQLAHDVYYRRYPETMYDTKVVSFIIYACVTMLFNVLEPDPEITVEDVRDTLDTVKLAIQCMTSAPNKRTTGARKVGTKVIDAVKAAWSAAGHSLDMDEGVTELLPWIIQLFPDAFTDGSDGRTLLGEQADLCGTDNPLRSE